MAILHGLVCMSSSVSLFVPVMGWYQFNLSIIQPFIHDNLFL